MLECIRAFVIDLITAPATFWKEELAMALSTAKVLLTGQM